MKLINKFLLVVVALASVMQLKAATIPVTITTGNNEPWSNNNNTEGSLQWAIWNANSGDVIDLSGVTGEITISGDFIRIPNTKNNITIRGAVDAVTGLPTTVINASTTASHNWAGAIYVDGATGVTIENVIVINSPMNGIYLKESDNSIVRNSFFGVDVDGTAAPNGTAENTTASKWSGISGYQEYPAGEQMTYAGIHSDNSVGVMIEGNVVSSNDGHGIYIRNTSGSAANPVIVIDNVVGLSPDSTTVRGNFGEGILFENTHHAYAGFELVSGSDDFHGNLVIGNGNYSAFLGGDPTDGPQTGAQTANLHGHGIEGLNSTNINVFGNYIGTTGNDTTDVNDVGLGNHLNGIYLVGTAWSQIGGCTEGSRNIVGNNGFQFQDIHTSDSDEDLTNVYYGVRHGVQLDDGSGDANNNKIYNNYIGVGVDGTSDIQNSEDGVSILGFSNGAYNNEVGSCDCGNNIFGGNYGVAFQGSENSLNSVLANTIRGTEAAAVKLQSGTSNSTIGSESCPNIITDNKGNGIEVLDDGTGNEIVGNEIVCNGGDGIVLEESEGANNGNLYSYINTGHEDGNVNGVIIVPLDFAGNLEDQAEQQIDIYVGDTTCDDAYICQKHKEDIPTLAQSPKSSGALTYITSVQSVFDTVTYKDVLDAASTEAYKVIGTWSLELTPDLIAEGLSVDNAVVTATLENNTSELNVCVNIPPCEAPINFSVSGEDLKYCEGDTGAATITASADEASVIPGTIIYGLYSDTLFTDKLDSNETGEFIVTEAGEYYVKAYDSRNEEACSSDGDMIQVDSIILPITGVISRIVPGDSVCPGDLGIGFEVDAETGLTYNWSIASGDASIVSGSESGTSTSIDFGDSGLVVINVVASLIDAGVTCVDDTAASITVLINELPSGNEIIGADTVSCSEDGVIYTVANAGVGSSFSWVKLPQGAQIVSANGADSTEVTIDYDVYFGDIVVIEESQYGCVGAEDTLEILQAGCDLKAVIETSADAYCQDQSATFSSNSVISFTPDQMTYTWSIPGATPSSLSGFGEEEITVSFDTAGTYTVTLQVDDPFFTSHDTTLTFTVKPLPVITESDLVYDLAACPNSTDTLAVLDDDLGANYSLDNVNYSSDTSFILSFTSGGAYDFTVYKELDGCFAQADGQISVFAEPDDLEILPVGAVCSENQYQIDLAASNASSTYVWSIPADASIVGDANGASINVLFGDEGGSVSVYEITENGCESLLQGDTVQIEVTDNPSKPSIVGSSLVCSNEQGDYSPLNLNTNSVYDWKIINAAGDLAEIDNQSSISIDVEEPLSIVLVEFNEDGCSTASDTLVVEGVDVPGNPTLVRPDTICEQENIALYLFDENGDTITDNSRMQWDWDTLLTRFAGGRSSDDFISVRAPNGGSYSVSVIITDSNNCKSDITYFPVEFSYWVETPSLAIPSRVCDYRDANRDTVFFEAYEAHADRYTWDVQDSTSVYIAYYFGQNNDIPRYALDTLSSHELVEHDVLRLSFAALNDLKNNRDVEILVIAENECDHKESREVKFSIEESRELDIALEFEDPICDDESFHIVVNSNEGSLTDWVNNQSNIYVLEGDSIQGGIYARYTVDSDTIVNDSLNVREYYFNDTLYNDYTFYNTANSFYSAGEYPHYYSIDTLNIHNTKYYEEVEDGDSLYSWVTTDRCIITSESTLEDTATLNIVYPAPFTTSFAVDNGLEEEYDDNDEILYVLGESITEEDRRQMLEIEIDFTNPEIDFSNNDYTYSVGWIESDTNLSSSGIDFANNIPLTGLPPFEVDLTLERVYDLQYVTTLYTNGACPNYDTLSVQLGYALFIPSIFSPTPGREHPLWVIENSDLYSNMSIEVFNRWGSLVYETSGGYNNDWDGVNSITGNELPDATYFYIIHENPDDEELDYVHTGAITIVR